MPTYNVTIKTTVEKVYSVQAANGQEAVAAAFASGAEPTAETHVSTEARAEPVIGG